MKVVAAAVLLLLASLQAVEAEDGDVRARENRDPDRYLANGSKQGHQGQNPNTNEKSMKKFKAKCQLKSQANPSLQEILPGGLSFAMGDKEMSLADSDLEPVEVFVPGAKVVVDGVEQEAKSCVFKEKGDDGSLIAKDRTGKLVMASSIDRVTGKTMNVIPMEDGSNMYATVSSDDVDTDMLNEFTLEDVAAPFERNLQVQFEEMDARFLEDKDCNYYGYDVIEMAVVVDSYLCIDKDGRYAVEALAHSIVAGASQFYEVAGLCVKLRISYLEIHCDPNTDPIRPLLDAAGTSGVCSSGLLGYFEDYVRTNGISADASHLFHGKDFTGVSTIGCAYVGTLCSTGGYNTGVNEINFTNYPPSMHKLVAHENGHICSARHVYDDRNDVMYPSICSDCNSFGSTSKGSINQMIASTSCTSIEDRAPSYTDSPTPAPTGTPTAAPTPCDNVSFVLNLTTDKYAYETSWELMTSDGTIVESSPSYDQYSNYTQEYCVPDEELTFTIYDSFGDGICCRYGNGSYQITFKGILVASGGEFGSSESVTFGGGAGPSPATAAPTEQPTQAPTEPTVAPTSTPTKSPVTTSTTTPTKSPVVASTTMPTNSPVTASTTTPTKSPTAEPTLIPTKPPTAEPTIAPTKSPTVAPIQLPTSSPTTAPSSSPTESPVVAATSAPTDSPSCKQEFVLDLQTDNYPAETSWELKKASDGTILASRDQGFYSSQGTLHIEEHCVPDEELIFTIYDSFGDGICCGYGSGSYQITFKGDLAASGGEFGSEESVTFGGGPSTPSPTEQPTKSPTRRPTELPTDLPTKSPTDTAAPTKSPTEAPTESPTSPPTESPTFSPTKSPTTRPTESPTEPDTCTKKPQGDKCKNDADCCSDLCEKVGKKKLCVTNRRRNLKGAKLEPSKHKVRRRSGF